MGKEDVVHIYNGILLSHKKYKILPFGKTWMDLGGITLSEISQTVKVKYSIISLICEFLKKKKKKTTQLTDTQSRLVVAKGGG